MNTLLIVYIFALPFVKGDPVDVQVIPHKTQATCTADGQRAEAALKGTGKALRFRCVANVRVES